MPSSGSPLRPRCPTIVGEKVERSDLDAAAERLTALGEPVPIETLP